MITQWKDLTRLQAEALRASGGERPIYVRPSIVKAMHGDGSAAIYLTQMIYWSQTDSAVKNDGWFYLTTQKVTEDLGMSRFIQERVRKMLVREGILEFEKRGLPAKNWYRLHLDVVLERLCGTLVAGSHKDEASPPTEGEDAAGQCEAIPLSEGGNPAVIVGADAPYIGSNTVKIYRKDIKTSAAPRKPTKVHVLPEDRLEAAVAFLRQKYPPDYQALPVTESQARRILDKLGSVSANATEEEKEAAKLRLEELRKGVVNIRRAVDTGELETRFVPGFAKFVGLGIHYGNEPAYKQWALKVFENKPRGAEFRV